MSLTGLRGFRMVKLTEDSEGTLAYESEIKKLTGAKNIKISPKSDTAENYGDDQLLETETAMSAIEVEIEVADLTLEEYAFATGYTFENGVIKETKEFNPPYIAFGFEASKSSGVASRNVWLTKGKCEPPEFEGKTKEDKIDFQSAKLKFKFMPRINDGVSKYKADTDGTSPVTSDKFFTVEFLKTGKASA